MGLTTSRPLIDNDVIESTGADSEVSHGGEIQAEEGESCWRYLIRKLYSVIGYEYVPDPDDKEYPQSQTRKRRRSCNESLYKDVQQNDKIPRLNDADDTNTVHDIDNLVRENVFPDIIQNVIEIKSNGNITEDFKDKINSTIVDVDESSSGVPCQPLQYLDFPFLTEESVQYLKLSRTMFVMRGLPGSGKSTVVRKLLETFPRAVDCSADKYFVSVDGEYVMDRSRLKEAHQWCQDTARDACRTGTNVVIIDNTGVKRWELVAYFKLAMEFSYAVVLVEPKTPWKKQVNELAMRNIHGVDRAVISKKIKDWDTIYPLYYGWFLHTTDTQLLMEYVRRLMVNCLDIKEFFDDLSNRTGYLNKGGIITNYSRNEFICHSTSRFPKGETKGMEYPEETKMLGSVTTLTIAGFIITPRTLGARVVLSPEQLNVYRQPDLEPFSSPPSDTKPAKLNTKPVPDVGSCQKTLSQSESTNGLDIVGPIRGRRAHITLGVSPGVRPVQTGVDQLDVLLAVSQGGGGGVTRCEGGSLEGLGQGRWIIRLDQPLQVNCLYSGGY